MTKRQGWWVIALLATIAAHPPVDAFAGILLLIVSLGSWIAGCIDGK